MYILHGVPDWGSQVIHMALAEMDVPFRFRRLDWDAGDFDAPAFRNLNPFGRIPVLETPDGPIFETAAILLYLCERHGGLAPATGTAERAQFLIWLILVANQLHPDTMTLVHPEQPGGAAVQGEVSSETHRRLRDRLAALDRKAETDAPWWLSPDRPSAISLYVLMLLRWVRVFPMIADHAIAASDYPALHRMAAGLERRAAIRRVLDVEGIDDAHAFSDPVVPAPA